MSVVGTILRVVLERSSRNMTYDSAIAQLQKGQATVLARMDGAADTAENRKLARHIIGIERWGQHRLGVPKGEPLTTDEYDSYQPQEALDIDRLREAFSIVRGQTLDLVKQFQADGVITDWVVRGGEPTPLSAIIVKPNGLRTIVNYRGHSEGACAGHFDLAKLHTQSILIDGHQFELAKELTQYAKTNRVPIVIDADALRPQTAELVQLVDYVVASERFAQEYSGEGDAEVGLAKLSQVAPNVVVTLGDRGLIWQRVDGRGRLAAFPINAVDTTGAGDAFHGAFAAGLAQGMAWDDLLRYASAVGALCCTKVGGRVGIPTGQEVTAFLMQHANELRG